LYSKTGLAALILALRISAADTSSLIALPRLMKKLKRPGQFIVFQDGLRRTICLNSGSVGYIVDNLCESTSRVWGCRIMSRHVHEGRGAMLRLLLFSLLPSHTWLIAPEFRATEEIEWK